MSITAFKANFKGGVRNTLYEVRLSFPVAVVGGAEAARQGTYLCKGAAIPAANIGVIPVYFRGRVINQAGDRTFDPVTLTFTNDVDWKLRKAWEDWFQIMSHSELLVGQPNMNLNKVDIEVAQLGRDGSTLARYKLIGAWPSDVSQIDLSYDSVDSIEEYSVTIQVDDIVRL